MILAFILGLAVGSVATICVLYTLSKRFLKASIEQSNRRVILYNKATTLYYKAADLIDTSKIWFLIGNQQDADDALKEAERLTREAKQCEEEANDEPQTP